MKQSTMKYGTFHCDTAEVENCINGSFNLHSRDRLQTVNNVMGDAYGAGLIAHISKDLKEQNIFCNDDKVKDGISKQTIENGVIVMDTRL